MWKLDKPLMQNWTGCDSLQQHNTIDLTDSRDNNVYTVSKLKDGKCWMIQNLRIVNTSVSSSDSAMASGNFTIPASDLSKYNSPDYNSDLVYYDDNSDHGAYYSWHTATAGSGTNSVTDGDVDYSICPKGWHLPLQSEYAALYEKYPDYVQMTANPIPHFFPFGYISSTSSTLDGTRESLYWSATANGSSAYDLDVIPSSPRINAQDSSPKYYGAFVRCVAGSFPGQKHTFNITYNANGGSSTPDPQIGSTYSDSIKLRGSLYRAAYDFLGWCTINPGSSTTCSGKLYNGNQEIALSGGGINLNLYAMWKSYPSMSSFQCSSLSTGQNTIVNYDDKQLVKIYKLRDNKCWSDSVYYNGKSVMNYSEADMACPSGWHIPTKPESDNMLKIYHPSFSTSYTSINQTFSTTYFWSDFIGRNDQLHYWTSGTCSSGRYYVGLYKQSNTSTLMQISCQDSSYPSSVRCVSS